jgi:DNA-binding CsgD family transcriptional regulator
MQLDDYAALSLSHSSDDLHSVMMRRMHALGFSRMGAGAIVDGHHNSQVMVRGVDNAPAGYRDSFDDMGAARRDPVMQHCRIFGTPLVWDQSTYVAAGCADKWDAQAAYGYKTGIACVLHLPRGRHFYIGLDREQALPTDRSEVLRVVADLQLCTVLAYEAAFRVLWPEDPMPDHVQPLTPREVECLRWTMEGKTAWEVGRILSISEQTAVRHVNNATHKLSCVNKHQAVLKALRLGLIS